MLNSSRAKQVIARSPCRPETATAKWDVDQTTDDPRPTVSIHTQGCKLNQADSERLARRFVEAGYRIVDWTAGADAMVLNTCTVTATADAKARRTLRAAHRANGNAVIAATGCYAQRAESQLTRLEGVSLVMGNTQKDHLVDSVSAALTRRRSEPLHQPAMPTRANDNLNGLFPPWAGSYTGRNRAMIKIQEGCDQVCAYCIVPKVRGRERTIAPETIIGEINNVVEQGCQEVVLTGTQLGTYGFDLEGANLHRLLWRILDETAVGRLRVSSLQAQEISEKLLELWGYPRMCPHFHVPLQSGSDHNLRAMRRRYDTAQFARTVDLIRHSIPHAAITTDLIVGFPGEGDAEYQESRRFAQAMEFSDMHIFPFSARPGTSAAYLHSQVQGPVKKARAAEMAQVANEGFRAFRLRQLGSTRPVLWETAERAAAFPIWCGLTDNYIRVSTEDGRDLRNTVTPAHLLELLGDRVVSRIR